SSRTPTLSPGLGSAAKGRLSIRAWPVEGAVRPTMTRMVVDFPAPLGPRNPVTRPERAVNETSSTAVKPAYFLVSEVTVIMPCSLAPAGRCAHQGHRPTQPRRDPEGASGPGFALISRSTRRAAT